MKRFFERNENAVAIEIGSHEYTFFEIKSKADELELIFRQEFKPGERILVSSENIFIFISSLLAFKKIGLIFCCWNGHSDIRQLSELVSASGYIKTTRDSAEIYYDKLITKPVRVNSPGDFIITTSGSSGTPKGVLLVLENIIENAKDAGKSINFNDFELEKWCVDIDFSLMSSISHLFMAWHAGIPLRSLREDSNLYVIDLFRNTKTGLGGAPLQISRLSQDVDQFHSGCLLVSSGDFLSQGAIKDILDKHKTIAICTFYGMTELSGRFCYMNKNDIHNKPGAAGRPIIENSLGFREKNDGELIAKSRYLFSGYFRSNGVFEKSLEIFATGDIAHIDKDGYVWLKGRANDTFKVSGEKVNRKNIEDVLFPILKGREFCILPVVHKIMGTCCALFVGAERNEKPIPLSKIVLAIRAKLPSNCIPVYSYLLDSLPYLENGKLDKQFLINNHKSFNRYK